MCYPLKQGEVITEAHISVKRPETGIIAYSLLGSVGQTCFAQLLSWRAFARVVVDCCLLAYTVGKSYKFTQSVSAKPSFFMIEIRVKISVEKAVTA